MRIRSLFRLFTMALVALPMLGLAQLDAVDITPAQTMVQSGAALPYNVSYVYSAATAAETVDLVLTVPRPTWQLPAGAPPADVFTPFYYDTSPNAWTDSVEGTSVTLNGVSVSIPANHIYLVVPEYSGSAGGSGTLLNADLYQSPSGVLKGTTYDATITMTVVNQAGEQFAFTGGPATINIAAEPNPSISTYFSETEISSPQVVNYTPLLTLNGDVGAEDLHNVVISMDLAELDAYLQGCGTTLGAAVSSTDPTYALSGTTASFAVGDINIPNGIDPVPRIAIDFTACGSLPAADIAIPSTFTTDRGWASPAASGNDSDTLTITTGSGGGGTPNLSVLFGERQDGVEVVTDQDDYISAFIYPGETAELIIQASNGGANKVENVEVSYTRIFNDPSLPFIDSVIIDCVAGTAAGQTCADGSGTIVKKYVTYTVPTDFCPSFAEQVTVEGFFSINAATPIIMEEERFAYRPLNPQFIQPTGSGVQNDIAGPSQNSFAEGATFPLSVQLYNSGVTGSDALNTRLKVYVPTDANNQPVLQLSGAAISGTGTDVNGFHYYLDIGTVPVSQYETYTFDATVAAGAAGGNYSLTLGMDYDNTCVGIKDFGPYDFSIQGETIVNVSKVANPISVELNTTDQSDVVTYTITTENEAASNAAVPAVTVLDAIPASMQYIAGSLNCGAWSPVWSSATDIQSALASPQSGAPGAGVTFIGCQSVAPFAVGETFAYSLDLEPTQTGTIDNTAYAGIGAAGIPNGSAQITVTSAGTQGVRKNYIGYLENGTVVPEPTGAVDLEQGDIAVFDIIVTGLPMPDGAQLCDVVPVGEELDAASLQVVSPAGLAASGGCFSGTAINAAAGANEELEIRVGLAVTDITNDANGQACNTVTLVNAGIDIDSDGPANNQDCAPVGQPDPGEFTVEKNQYGPQAYYPGETVTFEFAVTNTTGAAPNEVLIDFLPAELFTNVSASGGGSIITSPRATAVQWGGAQLYDANSDMFTLTVTAIVADPYAEPNVVFNGTFCNTATYAVTDQNSSTFIGGIPTYDAANQTIDNYLGQVAEHFNNAGSATNECITIEETPDAGVHSVNKAYVTGQTLSDGQNAEFAIQVVGMPLPTGYNVCDTFDAGAFDETQVRVFDASGTDVTSSMALSGGCWTAAQVNTLHNGTSPSLTFSVVAPVMDVANNADNEACNTIGLSDDQGADADDDGAANNTACAPVAELTPEFEVDKIYMGGSTPLAQGDLAAFAITVTANDTIPDDFVLCDFISNGHPLDASSLTLTAPAGGPAPSAGCWTGAQIKQMTPVPGSDYSFQFAISMVVTDLANFAGSQVCNNVNLEDGVGGFIDNDLENCAPVGSDDPTYAISKSYDAGATPLQPDDLAIYTITYAQHPLPDDAQLCDSVASSGVLDASSAVIVANTAGASAPSAPQPVNSQITLNCWTGAQLNDYAANQLGAVDGDVVSFYVAFTVLQQDANPIASACNDVYLTDSAGATASNNIDSDGPGNNQACAPLDVTPFNIQKTPITTAVVDNGTDTTYPVQYQISWTGQAPDGYEICDVAGTGVAIDGYGNNVDPGTDNCWTGDQFNALTSPITVNTTATVPAGADANTEFCNDVTISNGTADVTGNFDPTTACVPYVSAGEFTYYKQLAPGQATTVAPGDVVSFLIQFAGEVPADLAQICDVIDPAHYAVPPVFGTPPSTSDDTVAQYCWNKTDIDAIMNGGMAGSVTIDATVRSDLPAAVTQVCNDVTGADTSGTAIAPSNGQVCVTVEIPEYSVVKSAAAGAFDQDNQTVTYAIQITNQVTAGHEVCDQFGAFVDIDTLSEITFSLGGGTWSTDGTEHCWSADTVNAAMANDTLSISVTVPVDSDVYNEANPVVCNAVQANDDAGAALTGKYNEVCVPVQIDTVDPSVGTRKRYFGYIADGGSTVVEDTISGLEIGEWAVFDVTWSPNPLPDSTDANGAAQLCDMIVDTDVFDASTLTVIDSTDPQLDSNNCWNTDELNAFTDGGAAAVIRVKVQVQAKTKATACNASVITYNGISYDSEACAPLNVPPVDPPPVDPPGSDPCSANIFDSSLKIHTVDGQDMSEMAPLSEVVVTAGNKIILKDSLTLLPALNPAETGPQSSVILLMMQPEQGMTNGQLAEELNSFPENVTVEFFEPGDVMPDYVTQVYSNVQPTWYVIAVLPEGVTESQSMTVYTEFEATTEGIDPNAPFSGTLAARWGRAKVAVNGDVSISCGGGDDKKVSGILTVNGATGGGQSSVAAYDLAGQMTGVNYDAATQQGTVSYTYTLTNNTDNAINDLIVYNTEANEILKNPATSDATLSETVEGWYYYADLPAGATQTVTVDYDFAGDPAQATTVAHSAKVHNIVGATRGDFTTMISNDLMGNIEADQLREFSFGVGSGATREEPAPTQNMSVTYDSLPASRSSITEGEDGQFFITVTNEGDTEMTNVVVADVIPQELVFISSSEPATVTDSSEGETIEFVIDSLGAGQSYTLSYTAQVASFPEVPAGGFETGYINEICNNALESVVGESNGSFVSAMSGSGPCFTPQYVSTRLGMSFTTEGESGTDALGLDELFSMCVEMTNYSTESMTDVRASVTLPDYITAGSLPAGVTQNGSQFDFAPVGILLPGATSTKKCFSGRVNSQAMDLPTDDQFRQWMELEYGATANEAYPEIDRSRRIQFRPEEAYFGTKFTPQPPQETVVEGGQIEYTLSVVNLHEDVGPLTDITVQINHTKGLDFNAELSSPELVSTVDDLLEQTVRTLTLTDDVVQTTTDYTVVFDVTDTQSVSLLCAEVHAALAFIPNSDKLVAGTITDSLCHYTGQPIGGAVYDISSPQDEGSIEIGQSVFLDISISNTGSNQLENPRVLIDVPDGMTYTTDNETATTGVSQINRLSGNQVEFVINDIAAAEGVLTSPIAQLTVPFTPSETGISCFRDLDDAAQSPVAFFAANDVVGQFDGDERHICVSVLAEGELERDGRQNDHVRFSKTVSETGIIKPNDTVQYTLTLLNLTDDVITNATATDTFLEEPELDFWPDITPFGVENYDAPTQTITINFGTIPPGESVERSFYTQLAADAALGTIIENEAKVTYEINETAVNDFRSNTASFAVGQSAGDTLPTTDGDLPPFNPASELSAAVEQGLLAQIREFLLPSAHAATRLPVVQNYANPLCEMQQAPAAFAAEPTVRAVLERQDPVTLEWGTLPQVASTATISERMKISVDMTANEDLTLEQAYLYVFAPTSSDGSGQFQKRTFSDAEATEGWRMIVDGPNSYAADVTESLLDGKNEFYLDAALTSELVDSTAYSLVQSGVVAILEAQYVDADGAAVVHMLMSDELTSPSACQVPLALELTQQLEAESAAFLVQKTALIHPFVTTKNLSFGLSGTQSLGLTGIGIPTEQLQEGVVVATDDQVYTASEATFSTVLDALALAADELELLQINAAETTELTGLVPGQFSKSGTRRLYFYQGAGAMELSGEKEINGGPMTIVVPDGAGVSVTKNFVAQTTGWIPTFVLLGDSVVEIAPDVTDLTALFLFPDGGEIVSMGGDISRQPLLLQGAFINASVGQLFASRINVGPVGQIMPAVTVQLSQEALQQTPPGLQTLFGVIGQQ